ncbi:Uncharacterised protein [Mycobacteroides abscessus]|nr:Uncharacterised protein [Mycobacteroides abscessus]
MRPWRPGIDAAQHLSGSGIDDDHAAIALVGPLDTDVQQAPPGIERQAVRRVFGRQIDYVDDAPGIRIDDGQLRASAGVGVVVAGVVGVRAPQQPLCWIEAQLVGLGQHIDRTEHLIAGSVEKADGGPRLADDGERIARAALPCGW